MLPKWHAVLGAIFAALIVAFSQIGLYGFILIFFASVFIDFDHYLLFVIRKKDFNLGNAYKFFKHTPNKKQFQLFHTIEFFTIIAILSYFSIAFLFILIGMLFHLILDLIAAAYMNEIHLREFSFIRYLILSRKYPNMYV